MNGHFRGASHIFAWWLLAGAAAGSFAQQYPFLPVPGSPAAVTGLFQDSSGRLWLGGLEPACFDGSRFFFLRDYGIPPVQVYAFAEDTSGAIWMGAETGVYRFANGRVEEIGKGVAPSVIAASPEMGIAAVGPLGHGDPANASLVRFRRTGDKWITETVMSLNSPGPITLDPFGILLYPSPGEGWNEIRLEDVVRWRPGGQVPIVRHAMAHFPGNGPIKVARDHFGCVWWEVSGGAGVDCKGRPDSRLPNQTIQSYPHEGLDGMMVLQASNDLSVGRPGTGRRIAHANGLPGLQDAIPGRDGNIWIGTKQGLYRMASPFRIEYWTSRDGVAGVPWSIGRSGGRIYAGLEKGRIVVLTADRMHWDAIANFQERRLVSGLLGAGNGSVLASFIDGGAVQLAPNGKVLARAEDRHALAAMRLTRTAENEVWLGSHWLGRLLRKGSILRWDEHPLNTQPSANVLAVKYEEHTHKLWACYNGGLVMRDEHHAWREFTTRDGLLTNGCWSLAPLPNGDVWYAYYNVRALALIRPTAGGGITVRQYQADRILEPGGDTLDADQRGWLWRGGDLGVYVADASQAEAGKWLQLDRSDGLPANGMNSGSVFVDGDKSLWWGADYDLVHYIPPPDLVTPRFAPQVFVSAFSWDGAPPRLAEAVRALPHGSKVTAHIGSLQFDRRNALWLRYRVLPEHPGWIETRSLDLALGKLSAGAHTLEVQGRVFTGPWSGTASRQFTVLRPIGLTWPLLAGYFLVAMSLTAGGYLLRRRRLAEDARLLPDLAAWRMGALLPEIHELEGTLLDSRFEVGGLLARGGFSNVLEGYDCEQMQRCAIKVFRGEVTTDKAWIERRFEQEVAALQKVRHPNVVSIYAHGRAPSGAPYLVMEFVEGRNLREVLEAGPLTPRRTGRLLRQLAGALDAIHALEICHRDVKPENVIVRREGSADEESVLIDFSIAIVKDANETMHGLSRAAGSFDYMAPEQAVGYAEPSSDVYSLAKLVLEMLTGRRLRDLLPDAALDLPGRMRQFARGLEVRLSGESIEMLATALEFDPARRPRAAGLFAAPLVKDLDRDASIWPVASS